MTVGKRLKGIYIIRNMVNGHCYVGSAVNVYNRLIQHVTLLNQSKHHSQYLQRAWDKYGRDAFNFKPLLYCESFELLKYEQFFIDKFHPEYNINKMAGSSLGMKASEETKKKQSVLRRGRKLSEEHKQKISQGCKGHKPCAFAPEWREKQRASQIGKKRAPFTEEHRRKLSEMAKKRGQSAEYKETLRKRMIGSHPSDEVREKMSQSAKERILRGQGAIRNEKGIFCSGNDVVVSELRAEE